MDNNIKEILSNFKTFVLVKVDSDLNSIYQSHFSYVLGDFSLFNFKNYASFNDLINSIYRSAPICEGVGYYEYINQIKESIYFCLKNGNESSFIIPLRKDGEDKTHYFLMNLSSKDEAVYAFFTYFDQNAKLYNFEDFSSGTFKDELTGLFNYRTLVNHINENNRDGYLILFDLNGFKKINDNNGHEIGDIVLKEIANFLISTSSMQEVYYRRSGDEFMILIFEIDISYVFFLINLIERFIESIPQRIHKDIACSAAYGILELKKDNEFGYVVSSKLTDLAMYQAKNSHKLYHYISHQDALNIIKMGNLDERIKEIANKIGR